MTEEGRLDLRMAKNAGIHAMRQDALSKVPRALVLADEKPTHGLPEVTKTDFKLGKDCRSWRTPSMFMAVMAEPMKSPSSQG